MTDKPSQPSKTVAIRMQAEDHKKLKTVAAKKRLSVSALIRHQVMEAVEAVEAEEAPR